jgi:hypothetical protein
MLSIKSLSPCEYAELGCLYCAFKIAIAIDPPCSVVWIFSNGECEYARANSVQPNDYRNINQESPCERKKYTHPYVNLFIQCYPGFDIKKFRCAIGHCTLLRRDVLPRSIVSVTISASQDWDFTCWNKACERVSITILAFTALPKSMRIGDPSSAIITFLRHKRMSAQQSRKAIFPPYPGFKSL